MADPTQDQIRALGSCISCDEAAVILSGYYAQANAVLQKAMSSDPVAVGQAARHIESVGIVKGIRDLKARGKTIICRPSADFNQLIKFVGVLSQESLALGGRLDVYNRTSSELVDDIVDGVLDFGGRIAETASDLGSGIKNTAESALSLTGILSKILPLLVFTALGVVGFLYAKQLKLI